MSDDLTDGLVVWKDGSAKQRFYTKAEAADHIEALEREKAELAAEVEQLKDQHYQIMLEICGGEDAPGYAATLGLDDVRSIMAQRRSFAEYDLATLKADRQRAMGLLVEALRQIDALDPESYATCCSRDALAGLVVRQGRIARAALAAMKGEE